MALRKRSQSRPFEWLTMYTGVMGQNAPNQFQLNKQRYLSKYFNSFVAGTNSHIWMRKARAASRVRLPYNAPALFHSCHDDTRQEK